MKLSVIMLFICVGLAYASDSYSQNVLLNIDVNNKSVQEVLDEIEKQSDFHFFYNNKQVNTSRIVSIKSKQKMFLMYWNNCSPEPISAIKF